MTDYANPSFLTQAFGTWGQQPAASGPNDWIAAALADPSTSLQDKIGLQGLLDTKSNNLAIQDKLGAAYAPPSKWATGAQTFGSIAQGLAGLGSIYLGWKGLQEQKKEFNFNKEVTNTNLNNSILDYNRRLTDTLNNRALNNGQGQSWVSQQMGQWQAKRSGG